MGDGTGKSLIVFCVLVVMGFGGVFVYVKSKKHDDSVSMSSFVQHAIMAYQLQGTAVFAEFSDPLNPQWVQDKGETYIFVINAMNGEIVAHGAGLAKTTNITNTTQALINYVIAAAKEKPNGGFVAYEFKNPRTGTTGLKRSYVQIHDDYIFGSGKYNPDKRLH